MNKRLMKMRSVLLALVLVPLMVFTGTSAFAVGGGSGNSEGGGWDTIGAGQLHTAFSAGWYQFVSHAGFDEATLVGMLENKRGGLSTECKKSKGIWWVQASTGIFLFNFKGYHLGGGGIDNPNVYYGGRDSQALKNAGYAVLKKDNNLGYYHSPDAWENSVTIVCSYAGEAEQKWVTENGSYDGHTEFEKVLPYSYSTSIMPMRIEGKYVGDGNWEPQPATVKKTEFAKVYDSLANGKTPLKSEEVEKMVNDALNKDKGIDYSTSVELSEKNKEAFARGGVINVSEYTTYAKVRAISDFKVSQTRRCLYEYYPDGSRKLVKCEPWKETGRVYNNSVSKRYQTPFNSAFWQIISVHCNIPGLEKLVADTGATMVSKDVEGGKVSAVARTKYYTGQGGRPAKPATLDFGEAGTPSGSLGFYDKECAYTCEAPKVDTPTQADGNLGTEGDSGDGESPMKNGGDIVKDGATVRGNNFVLFRDNEKLPLHLDLWMPKATDNVHYKGEAPITTTVSRWNKGTPDVVSDKGGKFTISTQDGKALFDGKPSSAAPNQRNWDTTPYASTTTTILPGAHNAFNVQGSWASEKGLPNVLNVRWEYAPVVSSMSPTTLGTYRKGMTPSGILADNRAPISTPIQGKCDATFGSSTHPDMTSAMVENTGTGTENNLDVVSVDSGNPASSSKNLVLTYVRATAE